MNPSTTKLIRASPPMTPPTIGPTRLVLSDDEPLLLLLARAEALLFSLPVSFARPDESEEVRDEFDCEEDELCDVGVEDVPSLVVDLTLAIEVCDVDDGVDVVSDVVLGIVGVGKANKCSVTARFPQAIYE